MLKAFTALLAAALLLAACAEPAPVGDADPPDSLVEDGSGTGGL